MNFPFRGYSHSYSYWGKLASKEMNLFVNNHNKVSSARMYSPKSAWDFTTDFNCRYNRKFEEWRKLLRKLKLSFCLPGERLQCSWGLHVCTQRWLLLQLQTQLAGLPCCALSLPGTFTKESEICRKISTYFGVFSVILPSPLFMTWCPYRNCCSAEAFTQI